jgi:hypothetical protein
VGLFTNDKMDPDSSVCPPTKSECCTPSPMARYREYSGDELTSPHLEAVRSLMYVRRPKLGPSYRVSPPHDMLPETTVLLIPIDQRDISVELATMRRRNEGWHAGSGSLDSSTKDLQIHGRPQLFQTWNDDYVPFGVLMED